MDKEILTTSETAKLLGVAVRTAQLLIEGGALISWKTPGGHRRVHRSDVLKLMTQKSPAPLIPSARVLLLASEDRLPTLQQILAAVGGSTIDSYTDPFAASFSMGAHAPAVVIVDLADEAEERQSFLEHILLAPALRRTKLIALRPPAVAIPAPIAPRLQADLTNPEALVDAVQSALRDIDPPQELLSANPPFPVAVNEHQRLAALRRSGLLETGPEETFDQLTWLASRCLQTPIALVTMLTASHQLFKSHHGIAPTGTPRSWAFCNYTILQRDVFSVGDLAQDERFAANPAVAHDPYFRFYAGAPIIDPDGFALASLCVIDYEPRTLNGDQEQTLYLLAKFAADGVRLRTIDAATSGVPRA